MAFEKSFFNKVKMGLVAGVAALTASTAAVEAVAQQPSKPEPRHLEKEKNSPLPVIKYSPRADSVILNYNNRNSITGEVHAHVPETGLLEYGDRMTHEKAGTKVRMADHELCHQQYDQLPMKQKQEIIAALKVDIPGLLRLMSDYQQDYAAKGKISQQFADSFLVNEMVAHVMSYVEVPLGATPTLQELAPEVWNELVQDGARQGMGQKEILAFIAKNPEMLMQHIIDSRRYDSQEIIGFELQLYAPDIFKRVQMVAQKNGIGNNVERAHKVIDIISTQQKELQEKQERIRRSLK